ncbi:putative calcium-binding protein cml11 [Asimina triloba]
MIRREGECERDFDGRELVVERGFEKSEGIGDFGDRRAEGDSDLEPVPETEPEPEPERLDGEQIAELREIFRSFDRNNDGSLTQLELGSLLRSLALKPSPDQLDALVQKADTNSNGLVEFSAFVALVSPKLLAAKSRYTEEQLQQLFRLFDRDGNGCITAAELAHSMAKLGHALTAEELTGMIKEADMDGDGRISFSEFSQAITSAAFDNSWT